ncbi:hypothetical protein Poly51_08960 [Rubripirellula tenax]|uniref:Uncharacterized protein n=1 Tax=Rubripirellula tenax TaxID=2528015 RepID=A0A5C6FGQ3_9BACT|nr:hypothetical protein [Rubripirellula tenax]TWU60618.1 hypothetical protein Poly51_08960 [Rubripirellula tenax]
MTVSNCPRCAEPFRLPVDPDQAGILPEGAYGQCPWCHETFEMSDLMRSLPPMLVVKSAGGEPISIERPVAEVASQGFAHAATAAGAAMGAGVGMAGVAAQSSDLIDGDEEEFGSPQAANDHEIDDAYDDDPSNVDTHATVANETIKSDDWSFPTDENPVEDPMADDEVELLDEVEEDDHDDDEHVVPSIDDAPMDYQWAGQENEIDDDSWSDGTDIAAMRVSRSNRRSKGGAAWKTAVGVIVGGALSLPIADGLLTLAGRESMLGIWPSKSTATADTGVRASAPMQLDDSDDEGMDLDGRTMEVPTPDVAMDAIESDALDQLGVAAPEVAISDAAGIQPPELEIPEMSLPDGSFAESDTSEPDVDQGGMNLPDAQPGVPAPDSNSVFAMPGETSQPEMNPLDETPEPDAKVASDDVFSKPVIMDTPPTESAELTAAVDEANEMLDQVLAMSPSDPLRTKAMAMTYREISEVGMLADGNSESAKALLTRVKESPLLSKYENAATNWFTYNGRTTKGILVVGKAGTNAGSPTITVGNGTEIIVTGSASMPLSDQVIALGRIVGTGEQSTIELAVAEPL